MIYTLKGAETYAGVLGPQEKKKKIFRGKKIIIYKI